MSSGRIPSVDGGIQPTIVDAKGDLLVGVAADSVSRLAVGSNGDTLLADSSQTTGLRWGDNLGYTAGKNKVINGDFRIWQRGTSFSNPATGAYSADRWNCTYGGSITTWTISQQTFTAGTAPVAGYEAPFFYRSAITTIGTGSDIDHNQRIEDVRTFAGQNITVSFWAKADSSRTSLVYIVQVFGSGGSSAVVSSTQNVSLTTSWQRFTFNFSVPSISGKTIGTGSYLAANIRQVAASGSTLDIWGVQCEAGSVATAFQTATGTLAGELAACQRYYVKSYPQGTTVPTNSTATGLYFAPASGTAANLNYLVNVTTPVTMRTAPTITIYSFTSSQTGRVSNGAGTDLAANSGSSNLIGDQIFVVQNNSGTTITPSQGGFVFHYAASAEL